MKRPFRVPLSPVMPILSALACLYLMTNLSLETWLRFAHLDGARLAVYFAYGTPQRPAGPVRLRTAPPRARAI